MKSYLHIERIIQGNVEGRNQFTLSEFRLIRTAIGICIADSTDEGKRLAKQYQKILNKLNEIYRGEN